jgi:hypothetical protein
MAVRVPFVSVDKIEFVINKKGVRRELGAGQFGRVYEGRYEGHVVALKIFNLSLVRSSRDAEMEATLQYQLIHPHIVSVLAVFFDYRDTPPEFGVVMQRMENTVSDLLQAPSYHRLSLLRRLQILHQVRLERVVYDLVCLFSLHYVADGRGDCVSPRPQCYPRRLETC